MYLLIFLLFRILNEIKFSSRPKQQKDTSPIYRIFDTDKEIN